MADMESVIQAEECNDSTRRLYVHSCLHSDLIDVMIVASDQTIYMTRILMPYLWRMMGIANMYIWAYGNPPPLQTRLQPYLDEVTCEI